MRFYKYLFLFFSLLVPFSLSSSTWTDGAANDNWTDPSNWDSGFPNSIGAEADFPTLGAAQTVTVDAGITVSQIHFDSTVDYMINGPEAISFSGKNEIIVENTGTHTIAAPIKLNPNSLDIFNNTANPLTISGNISGSDSMSIRTGLTILSGTNSYSAGTTILAGAAVQVNTAQSIGNRLTVDGNFVMSSGIGTTSLNALNGSGTVDLNDNTLHIAAGDFSGTLKETAGPGNIIKAFANTLNLSGANTYTGTTTILQGTLNVTGSIANSSVQINSGAFLTGTGSVGLTTNDGTVSPGTSIGTLTVNGNYTQSASGDLLIEISDDGTSDLLNITGNANLDGTLTLEPEPGIYPAGSTFTFMNYASRAGTLTLIEDSSLDFSINYFGTFAQLANALHGAVLPIPKRLLTGNARQVADYLFCRNFLPSNPDLLSVMSALVSVPANEFAEDLVKLSPAQFGALPLTNLHNNRIIADVIIENTEKFYWCDSCDSQNNSQEDCQANRNDTSVWIAPIGYYYDQDGIQDQMGFDAYAVGVGIGASHLFFNSFHVGGGAGYTYSKIDWDKDRGDGHINSVYLGPSLGWSQKNAFINLLVMGSYNYYDIDRNIKFPGVNRTASNKHHSYDVLARLDGGYKFRINTGGKLDHIFILPEARVSYLNIFEERYTESGADSINLTVDSKYSAFLQPNILVKFLRDFHTPTLCVTPAFQVGWISNISLSSGNYKSRFYKQETCQPHFVVKSFTRNTNQLSLGLDLNIRHISDWIIDLGYRVDFLDKNYVMDGKIKVEKRF
ncbi:MAG: autotransporter domain-containing protein [Simkaniaceae bacterium]|nr:MAG: autotransporter domain-containing protein [Simkaniaceae bacterium]